MGTNTEEKEIASFGHQCCQEACWEKYIEIFKIKVLYDKYELFFVPENPFNEDLWNRGQENVMS